MAIIAFSMLLVVCFCLGQSRQKFPITETTERIKTATVIFRHGDRTPVKPYPFDPWKKESLWPVKFGELTNKGKQQHYAYGKWLRERYSSILSSKFDPAEIIVKSTDVDRTLMSVQANLAGLYPPKADAIWNNELLWQPIPVHTAPTEADNVLAMEKPCLAYRTESNRVKRSKAYINRLNKYQNLMSYLTEKSGMKVEDYNDINEIYSTLQIEELYNFRLPNWTHSVYPDTLREPACYSFTTATATPILSRLMVGPIMEEITKNMAHAMYGEASYNVQIYSGHDFTVSNVLNALGIFDGNCPVYTSSVIIELVHDEAHLSDYVRVLYRNFTHIAEPYWLEIPDCGKKCPFNRFLELYENLITVDWERECGRQNAPLLGMSIFIGLIIFATIYLTRKIYFSSSTSHVSTPPATLFLIDSSFKCSEM